VKSFPCLKQQNVGKGGGGGSLPTLAFLDFHPSLLQLMWLQAGPGQFSLPLSSIELCIIFFPTSISYVTASGGGNE